jgi:amidophosphoribosyltransferase
MCGVFGIYGHPEAANLTYLGLHALQHRGQESAGIATSNGEQLTLHRGMGQVIDVFSSEQLVRLQGNAAIGHVRYSTAGGSLMKNAQPIAVDYAHGQIAVAHNGNLTNANDQRESLEQNGSIFYSASDTEVIVHLLASSRQRTTEDRIADALSYVRGAFSLLFLTETKLVAVRDPYAIRPLCIGRLSDGGAYVVASEPCSFNLIEAKYLRDIAPGEMVVIDRDGLHSSFPWRPLEHRHCVFEYVYFARPDSTLDGVNVYEARKNFGRALADESAVDADVVVPVPDSAIPATLGYSERSGVPFEMGLVRSNYVGRTFIEPQQSIRHFGVKLKHSPVAELLRDKRVVVVDDSIVRGTTSRKIVRMVREAGAREVHLRISSPPTRWPCHYGIDTPNRNELIAATEEIEAINRYITSDTLAYLSLEAMLAAVEKARIRASDARKPSAFDAGRPSGAPLQGHLPIVGQHEGHCHACFSGDYPIPFVEQSRPRQMRLQNL